MARLDMNKISKKDLDDFVSKLEQGIIQKSKTLSFAGAWSDIDDTVFNDLTHDLISNRQRNRRRIDE